ncbi:DnaJ domain protein (macronuclear) [Tetrahymena thermophila SB210]|uniref:DnaJ domain protein n=1 Tax=Tetrahymena thermophila (strain SB210) TaxID=312017 RepID=I7MA74_TETTS|nr:DnaJ domain protein [Tetrahymena thermophila SB210]EAS03848.2 DnaJ domain protein [Tetrahymena thermophila SB210]|eukprot:XP_001024093.2 DnaJ domain protein [Tetrahymena thermophila SB210]
MSYYEILNIGQDAKEEEIKKAYRQKALEYHPDKTQYDIYEAREKFRELDEAYKVLSNDDRRALYDVYHRHKALFEKNQEIGSQMQNQLKKIFLEYEDYYQQNSFLNDSILDQIPMINLDLLIKIYNTRHQKQNYYNYYKQLSHSIMQDIEDSVERECSVPPRQTSAGNKFQKNLQTLISMNGQSYRNNSQQQIYPNKKNVYNSLPPKVKFGYDSSDSNTDQLHINKKPYESDESSNTQNQFFKKQQNQNTNNQGYSTNSFSHQSKTQEQIEDELMNEDDEEELVLNKEDINKYPIDLDDDEEQEGDDNYNQQEMHNNQFSQNQYQGNKSNIENPLESWIRQQENNRQQVSPQMQNFYQQYFNLINNYTNNTKNNNNNNNNNNMLVKRGGKSKGAINENEINENDPLSLYRDRVYSNDYPSNTLQSMSEKDKENYNVIAYNGSSNYQQPIHNYQHNKPQQQKLTKKQIKTLWQQTQQKKVIKRISKKQPVFKLIKKTDVKRPPIKWQQLQEKIQQVQQQLQQYSQFIMKYRNKKNQPSIMEISKQKYLELVERKKKLYEEQNNFIQKEDELDDYDATLDENELECEQYCLINTNQNNEYQMKKNNNNNTNQNLQSQVSFEQVNQNQVPSNQQADNQNQDQQLQQQDGQQQLEYLNEEDLLQRVNDYNNNKYINEEEKYNLSENNQEFEDQDYGFNQQMHDESDMLNFNDSQGYSSISQDQNIQQYMNENKEDAERVMKLIIDQQNQVAQNKEPICSNPAEKQMQENNFISENQQQGEQLLKNQSNEVKFGDQYYQNEYQQPDFIPNQTNQNNNLITSSDERQQEYNYELDYNKNNMPEDFNFNDPPNFIYQDQIPFSQDNFMETPIKKNNFYIQETPQVNLQQFNNANDEFSYSNQAKNKTRANNFQHQENDVSELDQQNFKNDESSYQYLHHEDDYNNHFNNQQDFNFEQNI